MRSRWIAAVSVLASLTLVACSSGDEHPDAGPGDGGTGDGAMPDLTSPDMPPEDAGIDAPTCTTDWDLGPSDLGTFVPAAHPPLADVVSFGGPVLAHPQLVSISYTADPLADAYEAFDDFVVHSSWLTEVGDEYGVGAGDHLASLRLTDAPPATIEDRDIAILIGRQILNGTVPGPSTPNNDFVYMIHFPPSTVVTQRGTVLCPPGGGSDYVAGYHGEFMGGGAHFAYAVIAGCDPASVATDYEYTMSHELIEAATDPYATSFPAYLIQNLSDPWSLTFGELADICNPKIVTSCGHSLTRVYSNEEALAGRAPCVPVPEGDVYYSVAPPDGAIQRIAAGSRVDLTVTGFSLAPRGAWFTYASVYPYLSEFMPGVSLSTSSFSNGTVGTLTITVPPGTAPGAVAAIYLTSLPDSSRLTDYTIWPIEVVAN